MRLSMYEYLHLHLIIIQYCINGFIALPVSHWYIMIILLLPFSVILRDRYFSSPLYLQSIHIINYYYLLLSNYYDLISLSWGISLLERGCPLCWLRLQLHPHPTNPFMVMHIILSIYFYGASRYVLLRLSSSLSVICIAYILIMIWCIWKSLARISFWFLQ